MEQHIFLIGFMGSGKTTLGQALSRDLEVQFTDMDAAIEQATGRQIAEIFETDGEAYFRRLEKEWVEQLDENAQVIALGGGTPCFNNLLSEIQKRGKTIYLAYDPDTLLHRLMNDTENDRPLVKGVQNDAERLKEYIVQTLEIRKLFYEQADYIFSGEVDSKAYQSVIRMLRADDTLF